MKSIGGNVFLALIVLLLILIAGLYVVVGYVLPHEMENVSAVIVIAAVGIAIYRSGIQGYPFWITIITAYPVIAPYIVREFMGFPHYSGRALGFQEQLIEIEPMFIAALSSLFLALSISNKKIKLASPLFRESASTGDGYITWLGLASLIMIFMVWLTEPGPLIGVTSYEDMRSYRIPGTEFAGAAWVVFAVANLGIYLAIMARSTGKVRKLASWIYWGGILFSVAYLLMHARRSEVSGYMIVLLCIFGPILSRWKVIVLGSIMIFALSIIGYVRDPVVLPVDNKIQSYAHLPGAPGNILIGYIVAYELVDRGDISIVPGETYLGQIERILPAAFGLQRPAIAYDHVYEKVALSGGEFYLIEPYMNFGVPGIVAFLAGLALLLNWAIDVIARYAGNPVGLPRFIIAGTFSAMLFRTLWYGIGATVKAMIIAAAIGFLIALVVYSVKRSRGVFTNAVPGKSFHGLGRL